MEKWAVIMSIEVTNNGTLEGDTEESKRMRDILLDNLPCIALVLKKGTREIVASNEAARKVGAVPGKTCYQTCAARDDSCPFCLAPEMWDTNEPKQIEVEYNGTYYEGIWVPLTDDLYVHYIFDITERKQSEYLLKLNEKRLGALLQLSKMTQNPLSDVSDFVLENCVSLTNSKYGFIGFINEDESVFTRHARSNDVMADCKLDDKPVEFLIDEAGIWAEAVRHKKTIIVNDYEVPDSKKTGLPKGHVPISRLISVPIFDDGKIVALASMANKEAEYDETDVTQLTLLMEGMWSIIKQKKSEEEIHLHSEIMKNMSEGVFMIGLEDGIIRYTNPRIEEMFGYDTDEMIGKHVSIVNAPTDKDPMEKAKEIIDIINKTGVWQGEIENIKKDGTHFWGLSSVLIIDTTKYGKMMVAVHNDITELKKMEKLEIANKSLALSDKTKSEFLATMSHELRTPLNACIGFSDILKRGTAGELNAKQEKFVDHIHESAKHLLEIINNILDVSNIEAGKMELNIEKISLPNFIEENLFVLNAIATERKVVFKKDIAPEIDVIEYDGQRLRQVFFNLINNAIKFSKDDGGTVTVTAVKDGNMVKISISDTGIGIKEDDIGKLFSNFTQLDSGYARKYGGTGLELAITKKLVELHGGEIRVKSKYGEGSTFTFTLPIKA